MAKKDDSSSDEEEKEEIVEVPYEYEVEETVEREVTKEEPIQVKIPQVRASYAFKGQDGMAMDKGEVSCSLFFSFLLLFLS